MLLKFGWNKKIDPALSTQLLILFTFLAGGTIGDESANVSEEVQNEAFGALQDLFEAISSSPMAAASLINSNNIPALGHCMTIILDGIKDGPSPDTQEQALLALKAVWFAIKDQDALVTFLPGTVSSLTKSLIPSTTARRSRKVLLLSMQVLESVLVSVLSDVRTRNISREKPIGQRGGSQIDASWLRATAAQIKLALANIIKLRDHDDLQVRGALKHLCIIVLDECHDSLSDSASIMVETWMTLASAEEAQYDNHEHTSLRDLAILHPSITELIKTTSYTWVSSLPRIVQTNDESAKHKRMQQISSSYSLISDLNIESEFLFLTLTQSLTNSVGTVLEAEKIPSGVQSTEIITTTGTIPFSSVDENLQVLRFSPIIMPHLSQKQSREDFLALIARMGTPESQLKMARETLGYMRTASGISQLAACWLSFNLVKAAEAKSREMNEFLSLDSQGTDETLLELYSFSAGVLSGNESEISDWRLQATAIEIVAYAAQSQKSAFRTELVDVLYPIVQLIGSPNFALRDHAMAGVNIISEACGYTNTSDLIVDNVDYMVNAISMRLNTFDISPQAPQVLIMMIRLSGPALLPFLDDVVGSIFAALDNFHGYAQLVEGLFLVLGEVVNSGSKSDLLQITQKERVLSKKNEDQYPSMEEIAKDLQKICQRLTKSSYGEHEDFPREPWKTARTLLDEANPSTETETEQQETDESENQELQKAPPPSKTYCMIQKITRLSQHYLTNQSPLLRRRLLDLICTASTALSFNEDEFLPLVNDIWPVLIKRLYDSEPFVVIAACEAIAELCRASGDFLSTRFATEWSELKKLVTKIKGKAGEGKKGSDGRGIYAQDQRVWQAMIGLLVALMECVRVEDGMFDDVMDLLGGLLVSRDDVHDALSVVNADAVWLEVQRRQPDRFVIEPPTVEGYQYFDLKALA